MGAVGASAAQLLEFGPNGRFIREIGKNLYAWSFAHAVRVDAEDNVWAVDKGSDMIIKFNPEGRVVMVFGRKQEASDEETGPLKHPKPPLPAEDGRFRQPTDVTWDPAGNTYISEPTGEFAQLGDEFYGAQREFEIDRSENPFDRGHLTRRLDAQWGATPEAQPVQLRAGTNGWTCFADNPGSPGDDPMCFDANFSAWATSWMAHKAPRITGFGVAYMLRGGTDASNTDPFKMKPDSGQPWVDTGPHVMVVVPDVAHLRGISTDPKNGGPYVMWANTPYAHVMVPVAAMGASSGMAAMGGMH